MADALLGVVVEKSLSLIQNEFATLSGLRKKAERLSDTLRLIRAVLEDAEERQMTDRAVKFWLQQLRDAAHVLEDILEDCSSESHQLRGLSSLKPKNIMFRYRVGHKLKEMMERLDEIAKDKNNFGLREGVRERPSEVAEWRQTSSTIASPQVYGRDEDKEKVVQFLLSPARCSDSLSVYPIVGLGGLGKTTLAQLVYNDQRVTSHFNLKIWVCVSENFTLNVILRSIIESVMEVKYDISNLDVMERKVKELLQSKRYLLVLDDVWKRNQELKLGLSQEKWDKLRSVLSCGSKGASILVSTRDEDVAEIMGTCKAHHLTGLTDDECWLLFKEKAFGDDKEGPAKLVKIGKEIVKRCKGLPLAAQVLGGLMRSRSEEKQWLEVKESKLWTLPDENGILPTLRLSYFYLTPRSKQCFAFCAIFPKDQTIMKQDLIHLWMANGFVSRRDKLDVEEVGNMIWNELYQKSFFQDVKTNYWGEICFKMHDLVHDLAQSITENECLCLDKTNTSSLSRSTHHIGIHGATINKQACEKVEALRTFYQLDAHGSIIYIRFPVNRSLRVLCTNSPKLPSLLENFTHLRYLELDSIDEIKSLPDSIYNLHNLEILKLFHLLSLHCLPKYLTRLKNLRHIFIAYCYSLSCMCPNIHKLSHLRTLSEYIVKTEKGHSLAELHDLNLEGQLTIKGLKNVGSLFEAQEANLKGKEDLRTLSLSWHNIGESKSHDTDAGQVLEELQPHPNLERLTISKYEGIQWPSWMGNNSVLINLVHLCLSHCQNCQQLPQLGKLPSLRELLIIGSSEHVQFMDDYECYDGVEVMAFPSLETLRLERLPNLERLLKWERGAMFPRLSSLEIIFCPKLELPLLPCVETLSVREGCSYELLRSISSLNNLKDLQLWDSEEVASFPEGTLNNLTCLQSLTIWGFNNLKELADGDLEGLCSLTTLEIRDCGELRWLPDGIRHLTALQHLTIFNCPQLEKRCKEGTGEDWHKIAHIPKVLTTTSFYEGSK